MGTLFTKVMYYVNQNSSTGFVNFTTKNFSQEIDLIAVTNDQHCSKSGGAIVKIIDALRVPIGESRHGDSYAVVEPSATTPSPCGLIINNAAASKHALRHNFPDMLLYKSGNQLSIR